MDGTELLKEISRRIAKRRGTKTVADATLAKEIGVTQPNLALWRARKELTARQIVNLMDRIEKRAAAKSIENTINPIVEFFYIDRAEAKHGANWQIFSPSPSANTTEHPYLAGLKQRLEKSHGVYIFHDSRGRAIYAGKAHRQSLWKEMNLAFNRDRGEVQNIKRVNHPTNRVAFSSSEDGRRSINKEPVALHAIASYMSAYEVDERMIGKIEALIVRAFANDLLNVKMENF
jgi:hypothetical protein